MNAKQYIRIALGLALLGSGLLKGFSGSTQVIADTLDVLALTDAYWNHAARAWQAVSVFEASLGLALLFSARSVFWNVSLILALLAFFAWDVARFVSGGSPDCGCFGGFRIASEWWHVWAKHLVLWGATWLLLRATGAESAAVNSASSALGGKQWSAS